MQDFVHQQYLRDGRIFGRMAHAVERQARKSHFKKKLP